MFDVCVIGHITKDRIRIGDTEKELPGGVAYYSSLAFKRLGLDVCLITKCAEEDKSLLHDMVTQNVAIFHRPTEETTLFENTYAADLSSRVQMVQCLAEPFSARDLPDISARIFHLGPLTEYDVPLEILRLLSLKSKVSLDVQGFVRRVEKGRIRYVDWKQKNEGLPHIAMLKADEEEVKILSGEEDVQQAAIKMSRYGIDEVIVTRGSQGSLIHSRGEFYSVPSVAPRRVVDSTGCGDTYAAGYIFKRLKHCAIEEAGKFAAATASLKLEGYGSFKGTEEDVQAFLEASSGD